MVRRALLVVWCWLITATALAAQPTPSQQNEYVPVDQLPPGQGMPAAPLLIAAYIIIWLALMAYLWSIWRRLGKVEADMQALQRGVRGSSGSHVH